MENSEFVMKITVDIYVAKFTTVTSPAIKVSGYLVKFNIKVILKCSFNCRCLVVAKSCDQRSKNSPDSFCSL